MPERRQARSSCYLSHKAVHSDFIPAERHKGRYATSRSSRRRRWPQTPENDGGKPMWVHNQRNSWHGVDFPYHAILDVAEYYRRYMETLLAVDDSVGRVLELPEEARPLDSTLVVYMGDNGFAFGEHGLIDKRTAYEESMRVPMLMRAPGALPAGTRSTGSSPTSTSRRRSRPPRGCSAAGDGRPRFLPLRRASATPGATRCSTRTTGSGTFRRRRRCSRSAANATSTSALTASGTSTSSTTCRPIRRRCAT